MTDKYPNGIIPQDEWLSHSVEWRKGWHDFQSGKDIEMTAEEKANLSEEWKAGARFAAQHPFGQVARPM